MIFAPPKLDQLQIGNTLLAGMGKSTIIADLDFETYSPAGFVWDAQNQKFKSPRGTDKKGLQVTGVIPYTEHPQAEVLCLAYDLKMGEGKKLWTPSEPPPTDLFYHVRNSGLLESWNVAFEYWVWNNICVSKYGFPPLHIFQLRCAAAKARAHALPGSLAPAGDVLNISKKKDSIGQSLIRKFCIPRNPTQKDARLRILPSEMPLEGSQLYNYCLRDIEAEAEISSLVPDLSPDELVFWQCDRAINIRGVAIDVPLIKKAAAIIEQAHIKYNRELARITNYEVMSASQVARLLKWVQSRGIEMGSLDAPTIEEFLINWSLPEDVYEALKIRQLISSASVKKLYSMLNQVSRHGRLHELFVYHSARTGRAAGSGPQPQNLPNSGPNVRECPCGRHYVHVSFGCSWCGKSADYASTVEWNSESVNDALEVINTGSLSMLEMFFGDAVETISGCLRGMFIAAPGHDLICSDYKAIEAVVLAALAGEEWRLEVFRTHGMIYEMSASKICGIPFEEFQHYFKTNKQHHPMRKKVGKVAELASGYGGWIGAWKAFGADEFFNDDEIKKSILAWREASPAIVEFWGGQERNWSKEYYGLEGCAVLALENPNNEFSYRGITYIKRGDALYCRLPSGRYITYHRARLRPSERRPGTHAISFEGWNTNPLKGAIGWVRIDTYSGKLTENVVQAVARDILAYAIVNLEKSGYPVVLHVHDEIVSEVPEGHGSVEEFERIMSTLPPWAKDWPLKASGGWRAKRYGK